jgi:predicted membrane-bound spermidine synthase
MKHMAYLILGTVLIGLASVPALYFLYHVKDPTFRDAAMGNWFATAMGVIVGVPVALWIARKQARQSEQSERLHLAL